MLFRLNHSCNHPACAGQPGQVLDLAPEWVAYLLARQGGEVVEPRAAKPERPAAVELNTTPETAPTPAAEQSAPPPALESARAKRRRG